MTSATLQTLEQQILNNLSAHGFDPADYIKIKWLVSFYFPLHRVAFYRWCGDRSTDGVLEDLEKSRQSVERIFPLPADQKTVIEKMLSDTELLA